MNKSLIILALCAFAILSCNADNPDKVQKNNYSEIIKNFSHEKTFATIANKYNINSIVYQGGITGEIPSIRNYEIVLQLDENIQTELMEEFKNVVEKNVQVLGGTVYGFAKNTTDFHVKYVCEENRGGILAYSAINSKNELRIIILVYEEIQKNI